MRMAIFLSACVIAKVIDPKVYEEEMPDLLAAFLLIVFVAWDILELLTR